MIFEESFLSLYLSPLAKHLSKADVTDIYINRPGEVWIETLGGGIERIVAPELTETSLWRLARQIAGQNSQGISRKHPLLAGWLDDGSRVQVVAPPATRSSVVIAIRKHVATNMSLEDHEASGAFEGTDRGEGENVREQSLRSAYVAGDWARFLRKAVALRKTIIVSGGTSTGKTTFLNSLIEAVPTEERLVIIEDTPEIQMAHANAVGLIAARGAMGEAHITSEDLLIASLRLRPDRIILGEVRGSGATTFLRAANTGHPGSLTTIHANSPREAISQLSLLIGQTSNMSQEAIMAYINDTVDIVVQLVKRDGKRVVSSVKML